VKRAGCQASFALYIPTIMTIASQQTTKNWSAVDETSCSVQRVRGRDRSAAEASDHRGDVSSDLAAYAFALTKGEDDESHILSAAATLPFLRGDQPFHLNRQLDRLTISCTNVPGDGRVVRETRFEHATMQLVIGTGWTAYLARRRRNTWLSISADSAERIDAIVAELQSWAKPERTTGRVGITFTYLTNGGPTRTWRSIADNSWATARRNYPNAALPRLDDLLATTPDSKPDGRIVLLYGPPGTGKSSLIRSLAEAWSSWCDIEVVVDPEQLLSSSAYLFETILESDSDDEDDQGDDGDADELAVDGATTKRQPRWRLFVLEDCGELLREDAKERNGQAMARLLNVADGVMGQGLRVLFCLSTNEDLRALHPAVVRPGRCFASIEIGRFSEREANQWLVDDATTRGRVAQRIAGDRSLAELARIASGESDAVIRPREIAGQYL
jgi:energy-coupling factor transporter ATP-binding protein EcfA2